MSNQTVIDSTVFKDGMRKLAGAVSLIATKGNYGQGGITATSVCSITLEPPTLMVSVNKFTSLNEIIKNNNSFSVNILKAGAEPMASLFAGIGNVPMEDRLSNGDWFIGKTGKVLYKHSLASFGCDISKVVEMNTHSVIFGQVTEVNFCKDQVHPLIYFNRSYLIF